VTLNKTAAPGEDTAPPPVVTAAAVPAVSPALYFGVLDSFKLGGIELRNIPVEWHEPDRGKERQVCPDDSG
jgi:hypothetical protein